MWILSLLGMVNLQTAREACNTLPLPPKVLRVVCGLSLSVVMFLMRIPWLLTWKSWTLNEGFMSCLMQVWSRVLAQ